MRKIYTLFLLILLTVPFTAFGQVTYTFDSPGNGYYDGVSTYLNVAPYGSTTTSNFEVNTLSALGAPAGADGNTSAVFHGSVKTSGINTMTVDLNAFAGSNDQQVIYKTYLKSAKVTNGIGVILRAQSTVSGYSNSARQGYVFTVCGTATSGTVSYRLTKFTSGTAVTDVKGATTAAIAGFTTGPLYVKAKAVGTKLYFEYSTDGITYTAFSGSPFTDATFASGTVQLAWGLGGGSVLDQYFDDVTITNLDLPKVTLSGFDKYIYTGSSQGPASATTTYFTGTPALSYSYKGIGTTNYAQSTSQPTEAGKYIAVVNATSGVQSANDTLAYEILPANYTKYYTFNADTKGAVAANTYYKSASNHLVQTGIGYFFNTTGTNSYKTTGNMLQPAGNAITTLASFGETDSIANDYQVIWKDYASATGQKRAVILRAAGTNSFMRVFSNTTNVGKGYMFYVNNTGANSLQLDIRKLQSDTTTYKVASILATSTTQTYNGINTATWYKATAKGDSLIFEYSTDGSNWVSAHRIKDDGTTYGPVYTSGTTQVSSINSGGSSYYFDYFGYTKVNSLTTALVNHNSDNTNMFVSVKDKIVTVANVANFEVYTIQGVKVKEVRNNTSDQSVTLSSGVYIIRSGTVALKAIVR